MLVGLIRRSLDAEIAKKCTWIRLILAGRPGYKLLFPSYMQQARFLIWFMGELIRTSSQYRVPGHFKYCINKNKINKYRPASETPLEWRYSGLDESDPFYMLTVFFFLANLFFLPKYAMPLTFCSNKNACGHFSFVFSQSRMFLLKPE